MIDFVQGILFSIEEDSVIINVNGIGYQIFVPRPDQYFSLQEKECFIHTHHYIREDWMGLFGFQNKDERFLFRLLLSVSGIGPKGALAVIAQGNPNKIIEAIISEDEKTLVKMPGIGKKTAQRIILDLKDKVKHLTTEKNSGVKENDISTEIKAGSELYEALQSLGYNDQEIRKAVVRLEDSINNNEPLEKLIKKALQILIID